MVENCLNTKALLFLILDTEQLAIIILNLRCSVL